MVLDLQNRKLLRACCSALMAADNPADLTDEERAELTSFADELAIAQGFENWIDAFHNA